MQFFEASNGDTYPISRIRRIFEKPVRQGEKAPYLSTRIYLDDDESVEVPKHEAERIVRWGNVTVIPAEPGTYVLTLCYESDIDADPDFSVFREPVIAWRINGSFGGVEPVVIDHEHEGMTGVMGILHPDGCVYNSFDGIYESIDAWESAKKADVESDRKRERERSKGAE